MSRLIPFRVLFAFATLAGEGEVDKRTIVNDELYSRDDVTDEVLASRKY